MCSATAAKIALNGSTLRCGAVAECGNKVSARQEIIVCCVTLLIAFEDFLIVGGGGVWIMDYTVQC